MNCKKYINLTPEEKLTLHAKLIHAIQSDEVCLTGALEIIALGEEKRLFDNVNFFPDNESVINKQPYEQS